MGQQQLLLIVLGVIIVGIAVVVGINLFNANAEESAKDTVVSEATNLGAMALQYFKKPTALGGGGNSFLNFNNGTTSVVPANLLKTQAAGYTIDATAADKCTIVGDPTKSSGTASSYTWKVTVTVDKDGVYTTTIL